MVPLVKIFHVILALLFLIEVMLFFGFVKKISRYCSVFLLFSNKLFDL